jgi:hypothetical protein
MELIILTPRTASYHIVEPERRFVAQQMDAQYPLWGKLVTLNRGGAGWTYRWLLPTRPIAFATGRAAELYDHLKPVFMPRAG